MAELLTADAFVMTQLDDPTLLGLIGTARGSATPLVQDAVFAEVAPVGTLSPWVVFSTLGPGFDTLGVGSTRLMVQTTYLVRVIGEGVSYKPLEAIADRIDARLHKASGSTAEGEVWHVTRLAPYRLPDNAGGQSYRQLGGSYLLQIQPQ